MNDEPQYLSNVSLLIGQKITNAVFADDGNLLCLTFASGLRAAVRAHNSYGEYPEMSLDDAESLSLGELSEAGWITEEEYRVRMEERNARYAVDSREARERQFLALKKEFEPTD